MHVVLVCVLRGGNKNEAVARAAAAVYTCAGFYISMAVVLHGLIYLPGTLPDTFIVMPRCGALPINLMRYKYACLAMVNYGVEFVCPLGIAFIFRRFLISSAQKSQPLVKASSPVSHPWMRTIEQMVLANYFMWEMSVAVIVEESV